MLRTQSQDRNIKLNLLAEQIIKDLVELSRMKGPVQKPGSGVLIDTAHERIAHVAERQLNGDATHSSP